jgi:hypothetical protein
MLFYEGPLTSDALLQGYIRDASHLAAKPKYVVGWVSYVDIMSGTAGPRNSKKVLILSQDIARNVFHVRGNLVGLLKMDMIR